MKPINSLVALLDIGNIFGGVAERKNAHDTIRDNRETKRGSKGVKTLNITDKNGKIVGFKSTDNEKDLMIITEKGIIIRMDVNSISQMGRVTKGVKLINLKDDQKVSTIAVLEKEETEKTEEEQE